MTRQAAATRIDTPAAPSVASAIATRARQLLCGLRGHDAVLHFEGKRVMLRCTSCGHDSPGWNVTGRAPRLRFAGDPRRHRLTAPHLVARRRA